MAEEPISRVEGMEEAERRAWLAIEASTARRKNLEDALAKVANSMARLEEAQRKAEEYFREREKKSRETAVRLENQSRETEAKLEKLARETDARIAGLAIAIGELMREREDYRITAAPAA
jgi:predicted  nucleic acid-binding Zn-ribbon protein